MPTTATGKVSLTSDLQRRGWIKEGLIQKAAQSFWAPYKGNSTDSLIMQRNIRGSDGHTIIFDYSGKLEGKPVRGKETATGTGEQKKKFSDKLTFDRYRFVVDNGDKFDGTEQDDLSINEHADSRSKLGDLWIRASDQAYFDLGQQTSEFGIDVTTFDFNDLLELEHIIKTGNGFDTTPLGVKRRAPLEPFRMQSGEPVWLLLMDTNMKVAFLKSEGAQRILSQADNRGDGNRLIKGYIGRIGNFLLVEAPLFYGYTDGEIITDGYYNYNTTGVYSSGLREYLAEVDGTTKTVVSWLGDSKFEGLLQTPTTGKTIKKYSRGLILGQSAFQFGMGREPDYKFQESRDFGITTESCLEVWCGAKSAKLNVENADYKSLTIAGYNYGCVTLDYEQGTVSAGGVITK